VFLEVNNSIETPSVPRINTNIPLTLPLRHVPLPEERGLGRGTPHFPLSTFSSLFAENPAKLWLNHKPLLLSLFIYVKMKKRSITIRFFKQTN
jgi:hypothetical protein